jgi:putative nucleotidyltransferase with HDIG domain
VGDGLELLAAEARDALGGRSAGFVVGGAVRDRLLGRPVVDWDILVPGDAREAAVSHARRLGGSPFPLSERHGAWRVVDGTCTFDFSALDGSLEDDLARRDFTLNAMAVPLDGGAVVDPFGGAGDLASGQLVPVSDAVFRDDPLRLLRLPRLAVELGLTPSQDAVRMAVRDADLAPRAAGERLFAELHRLLCQADPASALALADRLGVLAAVLPEVAALKGVVQNPYHHLDVFTHTLHVVDCTADIGDHLAHYFDASSAGPIGAALAAAVDGATDVSGALRWAALLHDVAKPQTRTETPEGAIKFFGHAQVGAELCDPLLARFNPSAAFRRLVSSLVGSHLVLGFMVKERPLTARTAYRFARETAPAPFAAIVLSLGDRLATRGELTRLRGLRRHHELAREMAQALIALGPVPPRLLMPADELAAAIGLEPGPRLGELVAVLQEEQAAGAVTTREEAVAFGRDWLAQP